MGQQPKARRRSASTSRALMPVALALDVAAVVGVGRGALPLAESPPGATFAPLPLRTPAPPAAPQHAPTAVHRLTRGLRATTRARKSAHSNGSSRARRMENVSRGGRARSAARALSSSGGRGGMCAKVEEGVVAGDELVGCTARARASGVAEAEAEAAAAAAELLDCARFRPVPLAPAPPPALATGTLPLPAVAAPTTPALLGASPATTALKPSTGSVASRYSACSHTLS